MDGQNATFKKVPVISMIFLTIITIGMYNSYWFLSRRAAINNLNSQEKLEKGVFIFTIIMQSVSILIAIVQGVLEGIRVELSLYLPILTGRNIDAFNRIIDIVVAIALLIQCFRVRRIFNEHFNTNLKQGINFSGICTFFFQNYYLQYKINRFNGRKE